MVRYEDHYKKSVLGPLKQVVGGGQPNPNLKLTPTGEQVAAVIGRGSITSIIGSRCDTDEPAYGTYFT